VRKSIESIVSLLIPLVGVVLSMRLQAAAAPSERPSGNYERA